jgi:small-conductance mechanosensitive channel
VLKEIAAGMQADASFAPWILEPLEMLGVDAFRDWSVVLKMRIKTVPTKQWEVGREFRKRIRRRFNEEGIEVPYPAIRADDKPRPDSAAWAEGQ